MPDVVIASTVTQLKWQGGAPPTLIVEAAGPFITSAGVPVNNGGGPFRAEYATTLNGSGYVVVPAVTLPSTEDSSDPTAIYFAYFQKSNSYDPASQTPYSKFGRARGFRVPASPTSTTWEDIDANMGASLPLTVGDRTANNLTVENALSVGGDTHLEGGLQADGPITSNDTLQVNDDANFTGTVSAGAFVGSGTLLTGVTPVGGSGGSSSTGSHTFWADSDNNEPAAIADTQVGVTTVTRAHRDYFRTFKPLRLAGYATASLPAGVETELAYDTGRDRPAFHDGTRWQTLGSRNVVYASSWGAKLDSDFETGGGTDDTAVLQAILDFLEGLGGGVLAVDGDALCSGLDVASNCTVDGLGFGSLYLADGSDRAAVRNANQTEGDLGLIVDENLTVRDIRVNGNRDGQEKTNPPDTTVSGGEYNVALQFFGVRNLRLENVRVFNSKNFSVHVANIDGARFDVWVAQPDYEVDQHDGLHVNGPSRHLRGQVRGHKITDDLLALNAFDPVNIFTGVTNGPITDVVMDVYGEDCYYGLRCMGNSSANYVDDVTVRIHGRFQEQFAHFDDGRQYGGSGLGDIRAVTLDINAGGGVFGSLFDANKEAVGVYSKVDHLTLTVTQNDNWFADYRPILRTRAATTTPADWPWCASCTGGLGDIRQLDATFHVVDPAGTDPLGGGSTRAGFRVENEGNITQAHIKINHYRDASVAQEWGVFRSRGGTCGELIVTGGVNRQENTFALLSGSLRYLRLDSFNDNANAASVIFAEESGGTISPYPAVSGDLFANGNQNWLGGANKASVGLVGLNVDGTLFTPPLTFAQLPTNPREGVTRWVTDSNTAVWGATVAGGGANKVLAVYDGTVWKVH